MKILTTLMLLITHSISASTTLISGYDDVIRQADNTSLVKVALKVLEEDRGFVGMPQFYSHYAGAKKFYLVSAISSTFENRIERQLQAENYPAHELYLRNWLTEWSIEDFKLSRIRKIIDMLPEDRFIIIFDNSEASMELTKTLRAEFKEKILEIYLREIVKKAPPPGARFFHTAYDIARNEASHGRFSKAAAQFIYQSLESTKDKTLIIPNYAYCPEQFKYCSHNSRLE
jgi:phosphatidate phosphatase APP1